MTENEAACLLDETRTFGQPALISTTTYEAAMRGPTLRRIQPLFSLAFCGVMFALPADSYRGLRFLPRQ